MLQLIVIFAVALLALPLIDMLADPQKPQRSRWLKIIIIAATLIWLVYVLFLAPVVSFPAWRVNRP